MSPGLIALLAAAIVALVGGVAWRGLNGRMRPVKVRNVPAAADAPWAGNVPLPDPASAPPVQGGAGPELVLTGEQLGQPLGERATLVQFSSAFCAPCRATRRILGDVAGMVDGVAHVEIDAESRLDLVRELNVLRTPTVLVLDANGQIARRASGQPRKPDVLAALGEAIGVAVADRATGQEATRQEATADQPTAHQATGDQATGDQATAGQATIG